MGKKKRKKIKYVYLAPLGRKNRTKIRVKVRGSIMKKRFGRTSQASKLNRRTRDIILEGVKLGLPLSRCGDLIGIHQNTLNTWMDYGKDSRRGKYAYLRQKVFAARTKRELEALEAIRKAGQGGFEKTETTIKRGPKGVEKITKTSKSYPQWQAEAWFLERRHQATYGKDNPESEKTPEELANEIRDAYLHLSKSVPT